MSSSQTHLKGRIIGHPDQTRLSLWDAHNNRVLEATFPAPECAEQAAAFGTLLETLAQCFQRKVDAVLYVSVQALWWWEFLDVNNGLPSSGDFYDLVITYEVENNGLLEESPQ